MPWLGSSVGTSERLKIVRSPVRSRPKPQAQNLFKLLEGKMLEKIFCFLMHYGYLYRWAFVGITTFLIDYLIFLYILSINNSVYIANFYSGLISITFNYVAHYFWSFKSKSNHSQSGIKYLINLILFWSFGTFLLKFLISSGLEAKYAKLIPVPIIAPLSFISLRFFVFKSQSYQR
jgi:putative flippase GtrA